MNVLVLFSVQLTNKSYLTYINFLSLFQTHVCIYRTQTTEVFFAFFPNKFSRSAKTSSWRQSASSRRTSLLLDPTISPFSLNWFWPCRPPRQLPTHLSPVRLDHIFFTRQLDQPSRRPRQLNRPSRPSRQLDQPSRPSHQILPHFLHSLFSQFTLHFDCTALVAENHKYLYISCIRTYGNGITLLSVEYAYR